MKQVNENTFESDMDKVFENINSGERAWGICLGIADSLSNWPEVTATENEINQRRMILEGYVN